jgi:hypothetical protein
MLSTCLDFVERLHFQLYVLFYAVMKAKAMPVITLTLRIERGARHATIRATAPLDLLAPPLEARAAAARLIDDVLAQVAPHVQWPERLTVSRSQTNAPQ